MQGHEKSLTSLPSELLTEIFRLATDNPVRDLESLVSWTPFEGSYASNKREECRRALQTKHALSLVCRLFRRLVTELLYEDVWIRRGSDGLREALETSKTMDPDGMHLGYGRFVKRVTLSPVSFDEHGRSGGSLSDNTHAILSCCPYVRVICRPSQETLDGQAEFIDSVPTLDGLDLPFLERVEWHNTPNDSISATAPTPSAFLFSQSLRVLILGPDNFPSLTNNDDDDSSLPAGPILSLPNLHTLGIQSLSTFGEPSHRYRYMLHLPSLRHLLIKRPESIFNLFDGALTPLCTQITALELAPDFRFLRQDFIATLLSYCTHTTDLFVPVFFARAPHQNSIPRPLLEFHSVRRVHLHAGLPPPDTDTDTDNSLYVYGQQAWWTMLDAHFAALCGRNSRFVALERVVLSGREWVESVRDGRFARALRLVRMKGVELGADDVDVRSALSAAMEALNTTVRLLRSDEE